MEIEKNRSINGIFMCWEKMALEIKNTSSELYSELFNKHTMTFITKLNDLKFIIPSHPTWAIYLKQTSIDINNIKDEEYLQWFLSLADFDRNLR
jgi:hypothetical protein